MDNNIQNEKLETTIQELLTSVNLLNQRIDNIISQYNTLEILTRINNLLMSRFILQLSQARKDLHLPKRETFFRFEILESDIQELYEKFGKDEVQAALFKLDRLLLLNKQNCPHNVKRYIEKRIMNKLNRKVKAVEKMEPRLNAKEKENKSE